MRRLVWPVAGLSLFVGLFLGVAGGFDIDVGAVSTGRDELAVPLEDGRAGGPVRAMRLPSGVRVRRDVAYGPHPLQRLDVYIPAGAGDPSAEAAPVLVMVHGGGWRRGDKASRDVVRNKVRFFAPKGYIFVSVNYRLLPETDPPTQAEDVAAAVALVQRQAAGWGGDPDRVVLMGHSAGAHLVSLLTAAPDLARFAGVRPWLGTVALDSAAYNVVDLMQRRHFSFYDRAFGQDPLFWIRSSPALRLQAAPPPLLLVCSTLWLGSCRQAVDFRAKVEEWGGRVELVRVVMSHGAVNRTVGGPGRLTDRIAGFLQSLGLP